MIGDGADIIFGTLNGALDDLRLFVEDSIQFVHPRPVLLTQPPSSRKVIAGSLLNTVEQLEAVAEACRSARDKLGQVLAAVERRKHDCQLALSPVSTLPTEILCYIFELAVLPATRSLFTTSMPTIVLACVFLAENGPRAQPTMG